MAELFSIKDLMGSNNTSYLTCGIHTNVAVKSVSRKSTPNKNNFVEILFEGEGGKIAKTLWEPKGNYPLDDETKQEALIREAKLNLSHISKLLGIFLTPEQIESFPNLDYENFIDKAIALLTPLLKTKTVNLKVIYDSDGVYTELGKYPDYVELYEEGVEPTLKFTPYELANRTTPKAKSPSPSAKNNNLEDLLS